MNSTAHIRPQPPEQVKRSFAGTMILALIFLALVSEWPETIDTYTYYGKWRSVLGVFGPLFTPIPGISLNAWQLTIALLIPFCLGSAARNGHSPELDRALLVAVAAIVVTSVWGLLMGGSLYFAYYQVWRLLLSLALAYMVMSSVRTERDLALLGKLVVLAGVLRAIVCIYYYWAYFRELNNPLLEYVTNHDDTLMFVMAILVVNAWAFLSGKASARLIAVLVTGLILYAIVLNQRRIAWVELLFSMPLMYFLIGPGPARQKVHRAALYLGPLAVAYVAAGSVIDHAVFAPVRALSTTGSTSDNSSLARLEEIRNLLRTLVDSGNPLFGTGWGRPYLMVERVYNNYDEAWILAPYTPHNSLLGLAVFSGFIGFVGVWRTLPIAAFMASRAYRAANSSDTVKGSAMISICALGVYGVHAYGDIGLQSFQAAVLLGTALGVAGRLPALVMNASPAQVVEKTAPPALSTRPSVPALPNVPKPFGTRLF